MLKELNGDETIDNDEARLQVRVLSEAVSGKTQVKGTELMSLIFFIIPIWAIFNSNCFVCGF